MVKSAPTEEEIRTEYAAGVTAKAGKWQRKFLATSGIAEAAKSDAAEGTYQAKMQAVLGGRLRQKGLQGLNDEDFKKTVRSAGPSIYSSAATAKAAKMASKGLPYITEAVRVANGLDPRTDDPDANIDARVKPIARALRRLKRGGA